MSPNAASAPAGENCSSARRAQRPAEAGVYYYKARAYHPGLGRFLQTDPIGYADGLNLYAYVGGDPVSRTDPSGLADQEVLVSDLRNQYFKFLEQLHELLLEQLFRDARSAYSGGGVSEGGEGGGRPPIPPPDENQPAPTLLVQDTKIQYSCVTCAQTPPLALVAYVASGARVRGERARAEGIWAGSAGKASKPGRTPQGAGKFMRRS